MRTRSHLIARCAGVLVVALVTAFLFVAASNVWVTAIEDVHAYMTVASVPARDVAIVPGSPTSQGKARATLEGRLQTALALYRANRVATILVSGTNSARDPETTAMKEWLEARGVPAAAIWVDSAGFRTRETMMRAISLFAVKNAVICTEPLHMPRALFLARHNGIDAVGLQLGAARTPSPRRVVVEALKTTLAFVEETLGPLSPRFFEPPRQG